MGIAALIAGGPMALCLIGLPAQAQSKPAQPEPQTDLQAQQKYIERCATEGGCRIYTLRDLQRFVHDIQVDALREGYRQGFHEGTQQACRRKDSV